jgi:uncharacterized membrane protein
MPFAARWTSTPPSLYSYGAPDYVTEVTQRSGDVAKLQPADMAKLDEILRTNAITHVFIGAKGGSLKGEMFWGQPQFKPVYDKDGVLIFEIQMP